MTAPATRIGDAERDAAIELLNRHFADGRLTKVEHEERVAAALAATTQPALAALLADVPDLRAPGRAPGRSPSSALWRGVGLMRLALLIVVVLFVAAHVVPAIAVVAVLCVVSRLVPGRRGPWRRPGGYGARW